MSGRLQSCETGYPPDLPLLYVTGGNPMWQRSFVFRLEHMYSTWLVV
jgi:hypothetical protein